MSDSWDDYAYDMAMEDRYWEELYDENVEQFTAERLKSYFLDHPDLIQPAAAALATAKSLQVSFETPALVFASVAQEVAIKDAMLKPVVHGLIHNDAAAALVTEFAIGRGSPTKFGKMLLGLLDKFGGVDLKNYTRGGATVKLWTEIEELVARRNKAVHQAIEFGAAEAKVSVAVAAELVEVVFPQIVTNVGLHLHGLTVCGDDHTPPRPTVRSGRGPIK